MVIFVIIYSLCFITNYRISKTAFRSYKLLHKCKTQKINDTKLLRYKVKFK